MSQISFTSKIVIANDFNTFLGYMYDKNNKRCNLEEIASGKDVYTLRAATCIAGGATNQKQADIFHFCEPESAETNAIYDSFKKLESADKKPNVLITGGFAPGRLSEEYFEKVMNKLAELKMKTSIIWGQKTGDTSIHYSTKNDTWTLFHDCETINSLEDLKKAYKIVKIADCDELWINNKLIKISEKLIKQCL